MREDLEGDRIIINLKGKFQIEKKSKVITTLESPNLLCDELLEKANESKIIEYSIRAIGYDNIIISASVDKFAFLIDSEILASLRESCKKKKKHRMNLFNKNISKQKRKIIKNKSFEQISTVLKIESETNLQGGTEQPLRNHWKFNNHSKSNQDIHNYLL